MSTSLVELRKQMVQSCPDTISVKPINLEESVDFLKTHPNSEETLDVVVETVQTWMVQQANDTYVNLPSALELLKRQDPLKNIILASFIEKWTIPNHKRLIDDSLVSDSYRETMAEIGVVEKSLWKRIVFGFRFIAKKWSKTSELKKLERIAGAIEAARLEHDRIILEHVAAEKAIIDALEERNQIIKRARDEDLKIHTQANNYFHRMIAEGQEAATTIREDVQREKQILELELAKLRAQKTSWLEENPETAVAMVNEKEKCLEELRRSINDFEKIMDGFVRHIEHYQNHSLRIRAIIAFNKAFHDLLLLPIANGLAVVKNETINELHRFLTKLPYNGRFGIDFTGFIEIWKEKDGLDSRRCHISFDYVYLCLEKLLNNPETRQFVIRIFNRYLATSMEPNGDITLDTAKRLLIAIEQFRESIKLPPELISDEKITKDLEKFMAKVRENIQSKESDPYYLDLALGPASEASGIVNRNCPNHSSLPDDANEPCSSSCQSSRKATNTSRDCADPWG